MKKIISLILVFLMVFTTNVQYVFANDGILDRTPDEEMVQADYDWLVGEDVIHYGCYADDLRSDVTLPTVGQNGSSITWASSDERWIDIDGTVNPPPFSFAMGKATVTLTAAISSGTVLMEKTFELQVVAQYPTDEDNVTIDKLWLIYEIILNGNSADNVRTKLNLPIKTERCWSPSGYYGGSAISWQSSNPDVIAEDGSVIRPAKNEENQAVTLTATISYGEAYETKTFNFVVTAVEEFPLAINYYNFIDTSRLKFNNIAETIETTDRDGNNITALRFNNDRVADITTGGSIFTKNKIRLGDDLSFSTTFSYSNPHPVFTKGEGGIIFTLQTVGDSVYSQSFNDESIKPSLNIAFVTDYYSFSGSGQATNYGYSETAVVYYNGDYENRTEQILTSGRTNDSSTNNNVWIEYDGVSKVLEVRFSTDGLRPANSNLEIENLELDQTLTSAGDGLDIEDVREVYVGFMGSLGNAKDKSEIKSLYFKNDSSPIDFEPYNFIDLSNVDIFANPPAGQSSSTVSARVRSLGGTPITNIPVSFSTSFGALDSSSSITNDSGYASVLLYSGISGNAHVKAYVPGGATALAEVQLAANDDDKLNFDSAWLTEERILGDNSALNNVTDNLNLPLNAPNGSTINWESNNTSVVDINGSVTRPFIAHGNQDIILTATIYTGDKSAQKIFYVTVKVRDEDLAAADRERLNSEIILDENESLDKITLSLNLPTTGENGSTISWMSDKTGTVNINGTVSRPSFNQGNQPVTLTATIKIGEVTLEKTFIITVIALVATDGETTYADFAWLTDGIILNGNESLDNVLSNLKLPTAGLYGSEISWESTNEDFATSEGIINRPTYSQGIQYILLNATIRKGSSEYTKSFYIKVDPFVTDAEAVSLDMKMLTVTMTNLKLPTLGYYGSSISWKSSDDAVISPDGTVNSPTFTQGNKIVTLTAHITKGSETFEKEFSLLVQCLEETDMEAVTFDYRYLYVSQTLGKNLSQYSINQNLSLPTTGHDGSSITWVSNIPSVISSNGEVTVPEYSEGNKKVVLTATFKKGSALITREYQYTVLSKPDTFPPVVTETTPGNDSADVLWNTREITIIFDEDIKITAPSNDIKNYGITLNGLETPSISVSIFKNKLTVNLTDYLKSGREYELVVPSDTIVDNSNNYLYKEIKISFGVEEKLNNKIEVVNSSPNDKEKQVYCETEQISFSYNNSNIIKGSEFENISLIDISGNKMNVTKSLIGDTVTLTLDSSKKLLSGSVYEVSIPDKAVMDRFDNKSVGRTIKFRTESSNILPSVKSYYPYNGQTGVDIQQKIKISFSEAINTDDCKLILLDDRGNIVKTRIKTLNSVQNTVFIEDYYLRSLKPNTVYTVKGPYNNLENSSEIGFEMFFKTGSNSLNITNRNVLSGGNLPINTPIEIVFSTPISEGANSANIKILDSKKNELDFIKSIVSNKVVLATNSPLNPSETYEFYIPKGAIKNQINIENGDIMFWRTTAERLSYGNYSFYMPSTWVTEKVLSFNARWLGQISRPLKSITWDFGDGKQASNDLFPTTVYWKAGNYKVTLTLVDDMDISYKFEQMITINGLNLNDLQMSVYNDNSNLTVYEENNQYGLKNIEPFSITLYSPSIGYVSDETVKVSLYKNGAFVEDLGNVKTRYNGEAQFLFNYGNKGYFGTYEVVFEHNGTKKQNVRKPVFFSEATTKQSMVVQLYNKEVGGFIKDAQDMYFDVNGEKKLAKYEKFDNWSVGCYIIKGLETGATYSLKLSGSGDVSYVSDEESIYHQGSDNSVYLTVETKHPGLNYIKSALTDSRPGNRYKGLFINNISIPNLSFELNGDWDGLNPGYYELKSSLGSVSLKSDKPVIELQPGLQMKAGEELWGRMVSKSGVATLWKNANVTVAPYPSLGYGPKLNISYVNGEYIVDSPVSLSSLTGGKLDILDGVPLLDSAQSFGLGSSTNRFNGSIVNGFLDLKYEYGSGHGMSTKKSKMITTGYDVEADIAFYGRLYYDRYGSKEWELSYYIYYFSGRGEYYWKRSYNIPKLDIGGWGKLTMGANIDGKLVIEGTDNDSNNFKGILEFNPYVSASIGAGIEHTLSVEGYVTGNVPAEFHIPTGYIQVEPNIQAGIVVYYIFDSKTLYSKEIARTHWDNGKEKVKLFSRQLIEEFEEEDIEFTSTPRNYLERGSQWLVGNNIKQKRTLTSFETPMLYDFDKNSKIETMIENIYPRSEVQLTNSENEQWLVWTDDNSIRDANNRTQLKYSVYRDGSWIEPEWFGDDETADFAPTTTTIENGMLLAWQNIKNVMTEENKNVSFVKDSEISVTKSIYEADGIEPDIINLTDDDKFDHSPVIAADNGKAILVWTKSEGLGLTFGEDMESLHSPVNSDCLYSSVWAGSTWSIPEKIEGTMPTIVDSSLTMHGEEAILLYTIDTDNDQFTQDDKEIYCRIYDGITWSNANRLTNNNAEDLSPKAVNINDEWFVIWQQDGRIMYKAGLNAETKTDEFLSSVPNNYEMAIMEGDYPQLALVYTNSNSNNSISLCASFYDVKKGIWSDVITLSENAGYVRSFSSTFTKDGKLNVVYTQAELIRKAVEETEFLLPSDKVDLMMLSYTSKHDLSIDEENGLVLMPSIPIKGTLSTVSAVVKNLGDFAENATLELYEGTPSEGKLIGEITTSEPIAAHSIARFDIEWLVGVEDKSEYELYVVVRPLVGVHDTNEENNILSLKIATSDVAVTDLERENIQGDNYITKTRIANVGGKMLEDIKVELVHETSGQILETKSIDQIMPGQKIDLNFLFSSQDLTKDDDGKINMHIRSTLTHFEEEYSTENNTYKFALEPASIEVDGINPLPNETKINIGTPLIIRFNMNVEPGLEFGEIELIDDDLNEIDINKTLDGSTLTIIPQSPLSYGTGYTLILPDEAVLDTYGHTMNESYNLSFVTTLSSPEIIFAYPGKDMTDIELDSEIKVKFNQAVMKGLTFENIAMYTPNSKKVFLTASIYGEWLYINLAGNLSPSTVYSLVIPEGALQNSRGEILGEDYILDFATINLNDNSNTSDPDDTHHKDKVPKDENSDIIEQVSFNDVDENAWYYKAVSFIAARGITKGTGNGNYSPEAKLTRGDFLVLMMRAYGIEPDSNSTENFVDVGKTYYTNYLATAKRLGISEGVGNNMFDPEREITRQEMFTLLYNVLKSIDKLPKGISGKTLSDFTDVEQVASWANNALATLVETGIIEGNDGKLSPKSTTTRAEMSQVLYNLLLN